MKSLFFYLILIVLFLAGTKLVCRQQQYTRSIQSLAQTKPTVITDRPTTDNATKKKEDTPTATYPFSGHYIHVPR